MRKVAAALIVWAALHGVGAPMHASELVTNGGFETGTFAGWTRSGNLDATVVATLDHHSGSYGAHFGTYGSEGYIAQNLATTPGGRYKLTFWIKGTGVPNELTAWWDGVQLADYWNIRHPTFTQYTFDVTASASSTALKLGLRNDSSFLRLDDVSVTRVVPVPSTLAGLSSMVAVGAVVMWQRRKRAA